VVVPCEHDVDAPLEEERLEDGAQASGDGKVARAAGGRA
jgi:hypothetical protein